MKSNTPLILSTALITTVNRCQIDQQKIKNSKKQCVSEWVKFYVPPDTVSVISEMAFPSKIAHTHNNETNSLNFEKHKTQQTT